MLLDVPRNRDRHLVVLVSERISAKVRLNHAQGGASAYAAAVLSAFGIRACIVTGMPPDLPQAEP